MKEEEKLKAADNYINQRREEGLGRTGDTFPAFIEGAEWFEEDLIDKACTWLYRHASDYTSQPLPDLDIEELIYDFRDAMEE